MPRGGREKDKGKEGKREMPREEREKDKLREGKEIDAMKGKRKR